LNLESEGEEYRGQDVPTIQRLVPDQNEGGDTWTKKSPANNRKVHPSHPKRGRVRTWHQPTITKARGIMPVQFGKINKSIKKQKTRNPRNQIKRDLKKTTSQLWLGLIGWWKHPQKDLNYGNWKEGRGFLGSQKRGKFPQTVTIGTTRCPMEAEAEPTPGNAWGWKGANNVICD